MISSLFITSNSGTILLYRAYDGDSSKEDAVIYCRNVIHNKEILCKPIYRYGKLSYFRIDIDELALVAISKGNVNGILIFSFLHDLRKMIYTCMNLVCTKESISMNVAILYELFDEVADGGYPQITERSILTECMSTEPLTMETPPDEWIKKSLDIKLGYLRNYGIDDTLINDNLISFSGKFNNNDNNNINDPITLMSTLLIQSFRPTNINYIRNNININIIECINVLYSNEGKLINCEVYGSICINCNLSGMPICHLKLNDDLSSNKIILPLHNYSFESEFILPYASKQLIKLDDYKFHQCVDLNSLNNNGIISFIPPDKPFVLMIYRIINNLTLPFILQPNVKRLTSTNLQYTILLKPTFSKGSIANKIILTIPLPKNTSHVSITSITSGTNHEINIPLHHVKWFIKKISKETSFTLLFTCTHSSSNFGVDPSRVDPISLEFEIPSFIASGLYIVNLDVTNKTKTRISKYANYLTKAGSYLHRITYTN